MRKSFEITKDKSIEEFMSEKHSVDINKIHNESLTFGQKVADKMADFAGSWTFIIIFLSIIIAWILINSLTFFLHYDSYPFILLNLLLSCIAALQAPIIMMSQNRQEEKDRLRSVQDYNVNLKAETLIEEMIKKLNKIEKKQEEILQYIDNNCKKG